MGQLNNFRGCPTLWPSVAPVVKVLRFSPVGNQINIISTSRASTKVLCASADLPLIW